MIRGGWIAGRKERLCSEGDSWGAETDSQRSSLLRTLADAVHLARDALPASVTLHERVRAAKLACDFTASERDLLRLEGQHDGRVAVPLNRDVVNFPRREFDRAGLDRGNRLRLRDEDAVRS